MTKEVNTDLVQCKQIECRLPQIPHLDMKSGNSLCKMEIEHVLIENVALN